MRMAMLLTKVPILLIPTKQSIKPKMFLLFNMVTTKEGGHFNRVLLCGRHKVKSKPLAQYLVSCGQLDSMKVNDKMDVKLPRELVESPSRVSAIVEVRRLK